LHFQRVALDNIGNPLPGLVGTVGIKLNAVAKHVGTAGDRLERHAIADARVDRRRRVWKQQESANPLGFGQWQRVEAESTLSLEAQMKPPF